MIITQAPKGTILESDAKQGEWYKVLLPMTKIGEKNYGYIHQSTVEIVEETKEPLKEEKKEPEKIAEERKEDKEEVAWVINKKKKPAEIDTEKEIKSKGLRIPEIAIKIGYNISRLDISQQDYTDFSNMKSLSGFCFGGAICIYLNEFLGLEPGIFFTTKGGRELPPDPEEDLDLYGHYDRTTWKFSYIEIPLLIKIKIRLDKVLEPYFLTGPYSSIKLKSKCIFERVTEIDGKPEYDYESPVDIKTFDFGLVLGGGIGMNIGGRKKVSLEARYSFGLINVNGGESLSYSLSKIKTRNFSIILGFSI